MLTPEASRAARVGRVRSCYVLLLGLGWLVFVHPAFAQEQNIKFDIRARHLTQALHDFSATTGIEILVDARHVAGRFSSGVEGVMAPRDALRMLLAGSNLVAEDFGPGTITLSLPRASGVSQTANPSANGDLPYFADIQRAVRQALCGDARTLPGHYRLVVKLWIGGAGEVSQSKRLDTTGDDRLDGLLDAAMQRVKVGRPPPTDLPQPVAVLIAPHQTASDCSPHPHRAPLR